MMSGHASRSALDFQHEGGIQRRHVADDQLGIDNAAAFF
jgi:hypothetical protein